MSLLIHEMGQEAIERLRSRVVEGVVCARTPPIVKIELFLTESCTLACDYCFVATKKGCVS